MAADTTPPLGKYLASTDKKTRDKAIKSLSVFLSDNDEGLPKSEMTKLWKGIFYCFWMSDKPLVQQALASELAELILTINDPILSLAFLRGFWEALVREWNGIDRLRIDKYYLLVRRFVNASFRLLIRNDFDEKLCEEYNDILSCKGGPLCPNDIKVPLGLAYHLSDIYVQELDKAIAQAPISSSSSSSSSTSIPLSTIFAPFFDFAAQTPNGTAYKRVQSALLEPLFEVLSQQQQQHKTSQASSSASDDEEEEGPARKRARTEPESGDYPSLSKTLSTETADVQKQVGKKLFQVASKETTRDANRRKLYAFWKSVGVDEDDD